MDIPSKHPIMPMSYSYSKFFINIWIIYRYNNFGIKSSTYILDKNKSKELLKPTWLLGLLSVAYQ